MRLESTKCLSNAAAALAFQILACKGSGVSFLIDADGRHRIPMHQGSGKGSHRSWAEVLQSGHAVVVRSASEHRCEDLLQNVTALPSQQTSTAAPFELKVSCVRVRESRYKCICNSDSAASKAFCA